MVVPHVALLMIVFVPRRVFSKRWNSTITHGAVIGHLRLAGSAWRIVNIVLMALQAQGIDKSTWVTWLSSLSPHPSPGRSVSRVLAGSEGHTLRARQSEGLSEYLLANLYSKNSREVPTLYGLITCPGHFLKQLA